MYTSSVSLPRVLVKWCGRGISYEEGLRIQKKHVSAHLDSLDESKTKNTLLLLEHHPVYTVGVRSTNYSVDEETRLRRLGADFYRTDRGGLITFHGPGQLVAYPILNLDDFKGSGGGGGPRGVKWYVCQLEKCLISVCAKYGFAADAPGPPLTGVWVGGRKIAAIGIHATKRTFVSHGLALNCNTDLHWFDHIVPCGLQGKEVTSLTRELARAGSPSIATVDNVVNPFLDAFFEHFRCEPVYDSEHSQFSMLKLPV